MGKDRIHFISLGLILGLYLTYFHVFNNLIYEVESLSVSCFNLCLIAEVNVALTVRSLLALTV